MPQRPATPGDSPLHILSFRRARAPGPVLALLVTLATWVHSPVAGAATPGEPRFARAIATGAFLTGALLQDRDGFLWFGSQGSGLYRYDGQNLVTHRSGPGSIADNNVFALHEDHEGVIWIGTVNGLTAYDKRTNTFRTFRHDRREAGSLSSNAVTGGLQAIVEDRSGVVWVGTRAGLNRYNRQTGTFTRYPLSAHQTPRADDEAVFALLEDEQRRLWVGTATGLVGLDPTRRTMVRYPQDPRSPDTSPAGTVTALVAADAGTLYLGTDHGLDAFEPARGRFRHYSRATGHLPNDSVATLHRDPSGTLWIGHNFAGEGLTLFDLATGRTRRYLPTSAPGHRVSSDSVAGLLRDRSGLTWVAHINGNIDVWDPRAHGITTYRHDPSDPTTIGDQFVNTSYVDRQGVVWFATANGLNRFDRRTGTFRRYLSDPSNPTAIPGGFVCGPLEDSDGNFWVLSDHNLSLFDRQRGVVTVSYPTFRSPISIIEDRQRPEHLWLVSWGEGLARFDRRTRQFTYFRHDPNDDGTLGSDLLVTLCQTADGMLWIPTMGSGLDVFDPRTGRSVRRFRYDAADPTSIGTDTLTHVFVDSRGTL